MVFVLYQTAVWGLSDHRYLSKVELNTEVSLALIPFDFGALSSDNFVKLEKHACHNVLGNRRRNKANQAPSFIAQCRVKTDTQCVDGDIQNFLGDEAVPLGLGIGRGEQLLRRCDPRIRAIERHAKLVTMIETPRKPSTTGSGAQDSTAGATAQHTPLPRRHTEATPALPKRREASPPRTHPTAPMAITAKATSAGSAVVYSTTSAGTKAQKV